MNYEQLQEKFKKCPIVPVMAITDAKQAVEVAKALLKGGISQMEILVRGTEEQQRGAIEAIQAIRNNAATKETMIVGAGTINSPDKMRKAVDAGAQFLVSADSADEMLKLWSEKYRDIPYYPTAFTTTEIKNVINSGAAGVKLFPKNQVLQPDYFMGSLNGIYGTQCHLVLSYDRTDPSQLSDIKYPIVAGIAAAWVTPGWAIESSNWDAITQIASEAVAAVELQRKNAQADFQDKIAAITKLAQLEPARKDQACQTEKTSPMKLLTACGFGLLAAVTAAGAITQAVNRVSFKRP